MVSKITYELLKNSDVFKNIPILTLDERWYHLINEKNKTDEIAYWEKQVNELLKKQEELIMTLKTSRSLKSSLSMMLLRIWKMMIQAGRSRSV